MAKPQGKCIFCDGAHLTKEHLWPKWMRPLLEDVVALGYASVRTQVSQIAFMNATNVATDAKDVQGYAFNKRLRVVCRTCNGGWMSALEASTKPILTALLDGKPLVLTKEMQGQLGAWVAMRTAIFERDDPRWAAITKAEYTLLFERKEPPAHWKIWISAKTGTQWDVRVVHNGASLVPLGSNSRVSPNCQKTVIGMREIALMCASSTSDAADKWIAAITPMRMMQIWPFVADIHWPTAAKVTDEEMTYMAYFAPQGV